MLRMQLWRRNKLFIDNIQLALVFYCDVNRKTVLFSFIKDLNALAYWLWKNMILIIHLHIGWKSLLIYKFSNVKFPIRSMICVSSWLSLHQSLSRGIIYLLHMGPESHFLLNYQDIYNPLPWSGTVTVIAALTAWHNALQSVVMATMPSTASQKLFTLNMLLRH